MQFVLCALFGYMIGNINPAYIISRLKGFDIRERGSGNAGASNAVITMGKRAGAFIALFDISKATAAVLIGARLFPRIALAKIISGSFCILGHIFPIMMHFHGGKGLASLGGMILAYSPDFFLGLLTFELILGFTIDYICVVPVSGSVIFTICYAFVTGNPVGTVILSIVSLVILFKHIPNFKRIFNGTEARISFLWKKDEEIKRIKNNLR